MVGSLLDNICNLCKEVIQPSRSNHKLCCRPPCKTWGQQNGFNFAPCGGTNSVTVISSVLVLLCQAVENQDSNCTQLTHVRQKGGSNQKECEALEL